MNSIEKAREFLHRGKCALAYDDFTVKVMADYAESAVREREREIADDLERIESRLYGDCRVDDMKAYIDRLRSETK